MWQQTISKNAINLRRGYSLHEHWNEFDLIDMNFAIEREQSEYSVAYSAMPSVSKMGEANGRMYDPVIGRFLSPDPYVQDMTNPQNFNRYSYCLNNPLKYTDPSGELFTELFVAAFMGGVINLGVQGVVQQKANNIGDCLKYFGIGFAASAAGGYAGYAAGGVVGTMGGFGSGAFIGAAGGFAGGFVNGAGNAWASNSSFADGIYAGFVSGGIGAVGSGIIGGVLNGITARCHGGNFWNGRRATYDMIAATPSQNTTIEVDDGMEYSNEYARNFSNKNFGKVKGVRNLYADGRVPSGYSKKGDLVYNSKGKLCMGSCQYLGKHQSDVYLYKAAFINDKELYLCMGHEYMHANFNYLGLRNRNSQHAAIFMWEHQQCHSWNYYPTWLSGHNPFTPSVVIDYHGNDFWFDYFDFRYKAFPIAK